MPWPEIKTLFRRKGEIRTLSAQPIDPVDPLAETERWARTVSVGTQILWKYDGSQWHDAPFEQKRDYLTWLRNKVEEERRQIEDFYNQNRDRRVDPLKPGSWFRQRNVSGMLTCEIACAINAIKFLGVYDATLHTEERIIAALDDTYAVPHPGLYAEKHRGGATTRDIAQVLPTLLPPDIRLTGSNSVSEMLRATADGAAVIFPVEMQPPHVVLIPPGFQLRRNSDGRLEIQVADSLTNNPYFYSVERMIKSEISTLRSPGIDGTYYQNSVLILARPKSGIRTISPSAGIRTIQR